MIYQIRGIIGIISHVVAMKFVLRFGLRPRIHYNNLSKISFSRIIPLSKKEIVREDKIFSKFRWDNQRSIVHNFLQLKNNFGEKAPSKGEPKIVIGDMVYGYADNKDLSKSIIRKHYASTKAVFEIILEFDSIPLIAGEEIVDIVKLRAAEDHSYIAIMISCPDESLKWIIVDSKTKCLRLLESNIIIKHEEFSIVDMDIQPNHSVGITINLLLADKLQRPCLLVQSTLAVSDLANIFHKTPLHPRNNTLNQSKAAKPNNRHAVDGESFSLTRLSWRVLHLETDATYFLDLFRTRDHSTLLLSAQSKSSSEVYVIDKNHVSESSMKSLMARRPGIRYFADICNNRLFVSRQQVLASDIKHGNMKLYWCSMPKADELCQNMFSSCPSVHILDPLPSPSGHILDPLPSPASSHTGRPSPEDEFIIEDFELFESAAIVCGYVDGQVAIAHFDLIDDGQPTPRCTLYRLQNEFRNTSSFLRDAVLARIVQLVPRSGSSWRDKQAHVGMICPVLAAGTDVDCTIDFQSRSLNITVDDAEALIATNDTKCWLEKVAADDGCQIPLSLLTKPPTDTSSLHCSPMKPMLLLGYGAYGFAMPMHYQPDLQYLLELGWIIGFAHVRGGGVYGVHWHDAGKQKNKINTFLDFASCASHVVRSGLTSTSMLCARTESAGGLIGGYMVNNHPSYFAGIVFRSPFLDISRTMANNESALTLHEVDEWGDAQSDPHAKRYIDAYCPTLNSNAIHETYTRVPNIFISVGLEDCKVGAWESARFADNIRHWNQSSGLDDNPNNVNTNHNAAPLILVKLFPGSSHAGPDDYPENLQLFAEEITFLQLSVRGGNKPVPTTV